MHEIYIITHGNIQFYCDSIVRDDFMFDFYWNGVRIGCMFDWSKIGQPIQDTQIWLAEYKNGAGVPSIIEKQPLFCTYSNIKYKKVKKRDNPL